MIPTGVHKDHQDFPGCHERFVAEFADICSFLVKNGEKPYMKKSVKILCGLPQMEHECHLRMDEELSPCFPEMVTG
jgi:hypothetical protein